MQPARVIRRFPSIVSLLLGILGIAFAGIGGSTARAQSSPGMDICSGGLQYYLAFADTTTNTWDSRFPAQLLKTNTTSFEFFIYSPVDQQVSVGVINRGAENVELTAGRIYRYDAEDIGVPLATHINEPFRLVIRIGAQYPVIVYAYQMTAFGCAAYTPLPVEAWGTEYFAAAWPGQIVRNIYPNDAQQFRAIPKEAPAEIVLISAYDDTEVTIASTADLAGCDDCRTNPKVVRLNAGEAYLVQSVVDTGLVSLAGQGDPAGTHIRSSKPIGVMSGNTRLMHNAGGHITLGENSPKDMAMEWISPTEQHGTEFVFTPTRDDLSFEPGKDVEELRRAEYVRLFSTQGNDNTAVRLKEGADSTLNAGAAFGAGGTAEERIDLLRSVNEARGYRTSRPAFGVASPEPTYVLETTGTEEQIAMFHSSSTYMTELVPREQWTSFAPVFAPPVPETMKHYLNVVTDSANRFNVYYRQGNGAQQMFPFNRGAVPGTDLVWGSISLDPGGEYRIEGRNGARFTGHVYGAYAGAEFYRAKESGQGVGEYHEDVALMYGYPLAPSRCLLSPPDDYTIETLHDCDGATVKIRAAGAAPAGLRSIILRPDSSLNSRILFLSPADLQQLVEERRSEAEVRIIPVDPKKEAYGLIEIHDRTRRGVRYVRYRYRPEPLEADSAKGIDLGTVQTGTETERTITLTNPLETDVVVRRLGLRQEGREFRILGTEPEFDWSGGTDSLVLKSGQTVRVRIGIVPAGAAAAYNDSLTVESGCSALRLPLRASFASACLVMEDLDFGTVIKNGYWEVPLQLCNNGPFPVRFHDSTASGGGNLLSIENESFTVADNYRRILERTTLDSGECLTIRVRFRGSDTGTYRTTARFWINGRACRDTSVWTAHVTNPSTGAAGEEGNEGNAVTEITPNPTGGETRIAFRLERGGETLVEIHDAGGRSVARLLEGNLEAGEHAVVWNGRDYPAGIYHVRIGSGRWSAVRRIVLVR